MTTETQEPAQAQRNGSATSEPNATESTRWVSVKEAAASLGLSERAVQTRAKRGQIVAKKAGHGWQVCLDDQAAGSATTNASEAQAHATATSNETSLLEQLRSEIARLSEQLAEKDRQLERRDQAESELRRLMAVDKAELQDLRARLAIESGPETSAPALRPWWTWWQRRKERG